MKNLIVLIIITSFFSCNQNIKKSNFSIEKFEKHLGIQETIYLNEIAKDLDKYLISNYPDEELKFKSYLIDLIQHEIKDYWKVDSIKLKKYRESKLFTEYDTIFPDSVWYDYNYKSYNIKYPDSLVTEVFFPEKRNIESTINSLKNEPRLLFKEEGNFFTALDLTKKSDSLSIVYIEYEMGKIPPTVLASGIMNYLTENNEYIAKRIFIMEILQWL